MPTLLEVELFCNTFWKLINPKSVQMPEIVNATMQLIFNIMIPPGHGPHYDFPAIPGWYLPETIRIALEDTIPQFTSCIKVRYDFSTDPAIGASGW